MKHLVIVGGGTSGWFAARVFSKFWGDEYKITVIADEQLGNIGVGEATVPNIKSFFRTIGITEKELFEKCDATVKTGIRFTNWNEKRHFYHPFYSDLDSKDDFYYWKALMERKTIDSNFDRFASYIPHLADEGKIASGFEKRDEYAYHFDTLKLGKLIKEKCIAEDKTEYIDDTITGFKQSQS